MTTDTIDADRTSGTALGDYLATQVHRVEDVSTGELGQTHASLSEALAAVYGLTSWLRVRDHRNRVVYEINRPEGL